MLVNVVEKDKLGILMALDQKTAFDLVNESSMFQVLENKLRCLGSHHGFLLTNISFDSGRWARLKERWIAAKGKTKMPHLTIFVRYACLTYPCLYPVLEWFCGLPFATYGHQSFCRCRQSFAFLLRSERYGFL